MRLSFTRRVLNWPLYAPTYNFSYLAFQVVYAVLVVLRFVTGIHGKPQPPRRSAAPNDKIICGIPSSPATPTIPDTPQLTSRRSDLTVDLTG